MIDEPLDSRFERDLRATLAELEPADAPSSLREAIAAVPERRVGRDWPAIRLGFGLVGLAAAVVVSVAALSGALRAPWSSPVVSHPDLPSAAVTAVPGVGAMLRLELVAAPSLGRPATAGELAAIARIARDRLFQLGHDASADVDGDRVVVRDAVDPGDMTMVATVVDRLTTVGRVDFIPMGAATAEVGSTIDTSANPALFSGDRVAAAAIGVDQAGARTIDVTFDARGTDLFAAYTAAHIGDSLAVTLDGVVVTAPTIMQAIRDGQVQLNVGTPDGFSVEDATRIVDILRSGALPVPVEVVASAAATPTPRPAALDAGLRTAQGRECAASSSTAFTELLGQGDRRGAVLLIGPQPQAPEVVAVNACLWQQTASGVMVTDASGGTITASTTAQLRVDRVVDSGTAPWHHLVAGRVGQDGGAVRVMREDGMPVAATVRDGWWLAWWEGSAGPRQVQLVDASGGTVLAQADASEGMESTPAP